MFVYLKVLHVFCHAYCQTSKLSLNARTALTIEDCYYCLSVIWPFKYTFVSDKSIELYFSSCAIYRRAKNRLKLICKNVNVMQQFVLRIGELRDGSWRYPVAMGSFTKNYGSLTRNPLSPTTMDT